MNTSLDIDTIQQLLKDETAQAAVRTPDGKHPRPVQLGPLGWAEQVGKCTARGCGSQTYVTVNHIHYCTSHALYVLNAILLQNHSDYEDVSDVQTVCTCKAGKHSMGNIHTDDCPIFQRVKDQRDDRSTTIGEL